MEPGWNTALLSKRGKIVLLLAIHCPERLGRYQTLCAAVIGGRHVIEAFFWFLLSHDVLDPYTYSRIHTLMEGPLLCVQSPCAEDDCDVRCP